MDRNEVISHLQIMHTWAEFALERDPNFFTKAHMEKIAEWTEDAIAMINGIETGETTDGQK